MPSHECLARHEFPVSRLPAGARREVEGGLSSHPLLQVGRIQQWPALP